MKFFIILAGALVLTLSHQAQAYIVIDWNTPVGGAEVVPDWTEDGIYITSPEGIVHRDSGTPIYPDNGTPYMDTFLTQAPLSITTISGALFNLLTVDLAEYSTGSAGAHSLTFSGYRSDGAVVSQIFTLDGIIDGTGPLADFETFMFNAEFYNLQSVTIEQHGYSMDNLVLEVNAIPEPATSKLLLAATIAILLDYWRRKMRTIGCSLRRTKCAVPEP